MLSRSHAAHAAPTNWLDEAGATLRALARIAWRNVVTRRGMAEVDDRMLADLGTRGDVAHAEMDRFRWDDSPRRRQPRRNAGASMWQRAGAMWQLHRSRMRIAALDAEMLKDIGVSFAEAEAEANKPFWRG